jgi:hypothetical protein
VYVSQIVVQEAALGDTEAARLRLQSLANVPLLELRPEARQLAQALIERGPFHPKPPSMPCILP